MAMLAGSTTITVNGAAAFVTAGTGMAKRIADSLVVGFALLNPLRGPDYLAADIAGRTGLCPLIKAIADSVAAGVVSEITLNASVVPTGMTAGGDPVLGTGSVA